MEGTVFADNFVGSGELHAFSFNGVLPVSDSTVSLPEPNSLMMLTMMLGFAGLVGGLHKRVTRKTALTKPV